MYIFAYPEYRSFSWVSLLLISAMLYYILALFCNWIDWFQF